MPIVNAALSHRFTVGSVDKAFDTDTAINVVKRREEILYRSGVPTTAANIAFVSSQALSSDQNLSIADRSTSVAANRITNIDFTTISASKTFTISTENFVVTDVFAEVANTITPVPLFYKHTLNIDNVTRVSPATEDFTLATGITLVEVEILDALLQPLSVPAKLVDLEKGIVYNNLLSTFTNTTNYSIYYVRYTVNDNGVITTYVDLLDNETVYRVATFGDLTGTLQIITDGRKVYLVEESLGGFDITLPVIGDYAFQPIVTSRLQIVPPISSGSQDTWFVRVTNGRFFTNVAGNLLKYHIAEFLNQVFSPEAPIKVVGTETSTILSERLIKLDNTNINEDSTLGLKVSIQVNDSEGNGLAAFTTDTTLVGTEADNEQTFVQWNTLDLVGIKSIDHRTGILEIEGFRLKSSYQVVSSYFFNEDKFEFTLVNFNPISNREALTTRLTLFIDPDTVLSNKTQTLFFLKSDQSGKVIQSNWAGFDNVSGVHITGKEVYYERLPAFLTTGIADVGAPNYVDPSELIFFVDSETTEGTQAGTFLVLGDITVAEGFDVNRLTKFDARRRGGGIIDTSFEDALLLQPEAKWYWDEGYWDGVPYPGNASYLVEVPVEILEGAGGIFTQAEVKDVVERHTAAGIYPVARAYGVEVLVTGIEPGIDNITLRWSSK